MKDMSRDELHRVRSSDEGNLFLEKKRGDSRVIGHVPVFKLSYVALGTNCRSIIN